MKHPQSLNILNIMNYKVILSILILFFISHGFNAFCQGKVTRPTKQQSQITTPQKLRSTVSVSKPDGFINGHGYVDLGLPSGTKWATCNLGANSSYEYGNYLFWGDSGSIPFGKEINDLIDAKIIDNAGIILRIQDRANIEWGTLWFTPSKSECEELVRYCKWNLKKYNGVWGYIVTGLNHKSIFLPLSGWTRNGESQKHVYETGKGGGYLTNTYNIGGTITNFFDTCYILWISIWDGCEYGVGEYQRATMGMSIRPVSH